MRRAWLPIGHVAHLAVELGLGDEGGDGVEDDDVDRVGADERLHDVERVFAGVGLGDEEIVEVHADHLGVFRIERVLDVDEGGEAALALGLGDDAQAEGRLAGGLRAVDLDDAALRQAADAEGEVDGERAGREHLDLHLGVAAEAHDRAFAELLGDGGDGEFDVLVARARGGGDSGGGGGFGGSLRLRPRAPSSSPNSKSGASTPSKFPSKTRATSIPPKSAPPPRRPVSPSAASARAWARAVTCAVPTPTRKPAWITVSP
jgi:hypothetical protein